MITLIQWGALARVSISLESTASHFCSLIRDPIIQPGICFNLLLLLTRRSSSPAQTEGCWRGTRHSRELLALQGSGDLLFCCFRGTRHSRKLLGLQGSGDLLFCCFRCTRHSRKLLALQGSGDNFCCLLLLCFF